MPACGRDFHCVAEIRDGLLVSISADMATPPYVHDYESVGTVLCPQCRGSDTVARYYNGFALGRITCMLKACDFQACFKLIQTQEIDRPVLFRSQSNGGFKMHLAERR